MPASPTAARDRYLSPGALNNAYLTLLRSPIVDRAMQCPGRWKRAGARTASRPAFGGRDAGVAGRCLLAGFVLRHSLDIRHSAFDIPGVSSIAPACRAPPAVVSAETRVLPEGRSPG